jgi:DNA modification methylase
VTIHQGDVREVLPTLDAGSVQCVVTSPPYWGLRDFGIDNQIGLESTPDAYVQTLVEVFREVRRVLRDNGTLWLNMGDSYASSPAGNFGGDMPAPADGGRYRANKPKMDYGASGLKPKDLVGIPWRVALALQADGWYLRSDIIWAKGVSFCPAYSGSVMPESVTDRPTKSHEYLFLLTKSARYFYDDEAVREPNAEASISRYKYDFQGLKNTERAPNVNRPKRESLGAKEPNGRNLRSVWAISPQPFSEAHFATFPTALVEPCIKAGSKKGDLVLDPFAGSGTVGCVALKLGRAFVGIELNPAYCTMARESIVGPLFTS